MTHEDYQAAAVYWTEKEQNAAKMPPDRLWAAIEGYLLDNNTCALATGSGGFIRCTPIEYAWHHGALWMFSEGGRKFVGLETNPAVCAAVFDKYEGFGKLKGMQITGRATLVEPFSPEYLQAAAHKNIPVEALRKLPTVMHLIKVVPTRIDFLNSDFKAEGYDSRQHWTAAPSC